MAAAVERARLGLSAVVAFVERQRPYRAYQRFSEARGTILAAGIAFYGVFSLFPILALGFSLLGAVLGQNSQLQDNLVRYLTEVIPVEGLFTPLGDQPPIIDPNDFVLGLTDSGTLAVSAVVGAVVLLWTGLGWIGAMRRGIRGVFRLPRVAIGIVRSKLLDLAVLLTLGVLVLLASAANVYVNVATEQFVELVGVQRDTVAAALTRGSVLLALLLVDTALFMLLYRVLAGVGIQFTRLLAGALLAGVGVGLLKLFAGVLLGNVGGSTALAAFAILPALLVWLNLLARVTLLGAGWAAVGRWPGDEAWHVVDDAYDGVDSSAARQQEAGGGAAGGGADRGGAGGGDKRGVAAARPPGSATSGIPSQDESVPSPRSGAQPPPQGAALPARWADRAVLGSGVVLGVTAAVAARTVASAARTTRDAVVTLVRGR